SAAFSPLTALRGGADGMEKGPGSGRRRGPRDGGLSASVDHPRVVREIVVVERVAACVTAATPRGWRRGRLRHGWCLLDRCGRRGGYGRRRGRIAGPRRCDRWWRRRHVTLRRRSPRVLPELVGGGLFLVLRTELHGVTAVGERLLGEPAAGLLVPFG